MVRPAQPSDWNDIMAIYARARRFMRQTGNPSQWGDAYPPETLVRRDLELGRCYVWEEANRVQAVFAFLPGPDPTYQDIQGAWLNDGPYWAVHRVASRGELRGVAGACLQWCLSQCGSVRIDTHDDNLPMQRVLEKNGFRRCGRIITDDGTPRIAYQRCLSPEQA